MPRQTGFIATFGGGEVSPLIDARIDLQRYGSACRVVENMLIRKEGAADRRGGTRFIAEVKSSTLATRLIEFEFSDLQAYIIEAGNLYFRFYKDKGRILSGAVPYEIITPYAAADLQQLKWCQSEDVVYLTHPKYRPRKLTRTAHTSWTLSDFDPIDGPYLDINSTATTLTASSDSDTGVTVTASGTVGINGGQGFLASDVGRILRIKSGSQWGWLKITARASTTSITGDVKGGTVPTTGTTDWRLGLWSDTTGWPAAATFHQERLVFASSTQTRPTRIDGSKTGDFENFTPGTADDDPLAYSIGSNKVNKVRWLSSVRVLLVGTVGAEFTLSASTTTAPLTPTDVSSTPTTRNGCADLMPIETGSAVLFLTRQQRRVRQMQYSYQQDAYVAPDLTDIASHVLSPGVIDLAFQQEPFSTVWCVRADGQLAGLTYVPEQQVIAWHRHILGGGGIVESVAVIPGGTGSDQVWLVVRRVINGSTKRYIEILEDPLPIDGLQADAFYVDSGLSYAGTPVSTVSGLDHLEGQVVQILADGGVHPTATVTGGSVTLNYAASKIQIGLGSVAKLLPMRPEAGAGEGTAQGKIKIISEVTIRFLRALGGKIGRALDVLEDIPWRTSQQVLGSAPPLFTGDKRIAFPGDWETNGDVWIVQEDPLPLTVLGYSYKVRTADANDD